MRDDASYGLGLKNMTVSLAEPNTLWQQAYANEAHAIRQALGDIAIGIQHVGSTAIPGIKAKPIIDILVGVKHLDDGLCCIGAMEAIGYDYAGGNIVPDDHIFGRGIKNESRTHLVHVVEYRGDNWKRMIAFRDALRGDARLARAYEQLKVGLAGEHAESRAQYTRAKQAFIDEVVVASGLGQ
ncbi:GrpB family protein [Rhizobium sp. T1470]|uniref:GrpB family protein n=1 Tax=unclassified Rhizobium TaxID=2613769 RepID=UPI001AAF6227|nr:GrpB family protein [Rhizobium sp. T1473]MCA0801219.1 GrpB family protein [Rhizobium sp. T1473]